MVCFSCGKYDYVKELCLSVVSTPVLGSSVGATVEVSGDKVSIGGGEKSVIYGPWMLVERKSQRGQWDSRVNLVAKSGKSPLGSRFLPLIVENVSGGDLGLADGDLSGETDAGKKDAFGRDFNVGVSSKGDLGSAVDMGRGREAGHRSSAGFVVGPSSGRLRVVETGLVEGAPSLKTLEKRLVGLDRIEQVGKDLGNNLIFSNAILPFHLQEAMSSMANLINSQVGADVIGGSVDGQMNGIGCASLKFPPTFWEYNRENKPDLIGLLEIRVSGTKADSVIAKLGFEFSHRVEAMSFSGGIWIGWKNTIFVDILGNYSQFILLRISGNSYRQSVLVTFVYGCPNSQKCKQLWEVLKGIAPVDETLCNQVKLWNKDVFGHIIHRKNLLKKKLDNVQKVIDRRSSSYLNQVELEIQEELESILHHEELLWHQNSRCDWLVFGDRNTRFFHRRALQRRKHNRIVTLKNQVGEWVMDEEELKQEAVNFYKNLYGEQPRRASNLGDSSFPSLDKKDIQFFSMPVSDEEIKKALFDMAPLKAPGSDDFHALFYQSQ
ncbi:hypothetical protein PVK06_033873 [Gossypium arboreum]|uniref:Reverse transcriptase n=1 Tax=Gossypium arboreum TaxID=29729 RepID=A0ABR0NER4_GOSAR|nr:hypothetical protein PVK06_033873 [Gossypium arboreum]